VDPQTREHLDLAERNRDLARALLTLAHAGGIRPLPYEWIAVIAFYSAVHYVSAYAWERYKDELKSHKKRSQLVTTDQILQSCSGEYHRLENVSSNARYLRGFLLPAVDADSLINVDLKVVESVVMAVL
jgi:hypothetical protein